MDNNQPHTVIESLEMVRRRLNWMAVGLGIGIATISFISLLLFVILTDYLLDLNSIPRFVLIFAAICSMGYVLRRWVIESLFSRLTLNDIASRVENVFPQYQDRLLSTLNFLTSREVAGSQMMRQRVVGEAARMATGLDMTQIIRSRPLWISNIAGVSAVLLLAILLVTVNPSDINIARSRLLTPFSALAWPRTVVIAQVGRPANTAAQGQRMDFEVRLSHGDKASRKVILHYQYTDANAKPDAPVQDVYMTRGSDGTYRSQVDARIQNDQAAGKLNAWVDSGDGSLSFQPIKVVSRLALKQVEAVISAPSYSNQPDVRVNLSQSPLTVVAGSKIKLIATFNKTLDESHPLLIEASSENSTPTVQSETPSGDAAVALIAANQSFHFHLHAIDTDGLPNLGSEEFECIVRADQLPTVSIESPQSNQDCTPEASLPMRILAEDDLGINNVDLMVSRLSDKASMDIPLVDHAAALESVQWNPLDPTMRTQRYEARYAWDLSTFPGSKLQPGDELDCFASVADNYLLHGETHPRVSSGKLRISIISQEAFSNKVIDELNVVSEQLTVLTKSQEQTQHDTSDLSGQLSAATTAQSASKVAFEKIEGDQNTIASQTKSLANKLVDLQDKMDQNKSTNHELRESASQAGHLLNTAAESSMKDAATNLTNARLSNRPADDIQMLASAQAAQSKATENLRSALERIGTTSSLSQTVQNLQALLQNQQQITEDTAKATQATLGKTVDELTPEQRDKLSELAQAQADLAGKTRKALDEMARNARALSRTDSIGAKAMAQAGNTAKSEDVTGQQAAASDATRQNQQSQAQTAQQQAQDGLKAMLETLQQAQRQKQDEVAKQVNEKLQGIMLLIQQQAGHNLDNLTLQGGSLMQRVTDLGQTDLFSQAGRTLDAPASTVTLESLISAQVQTEQDTRDLASSTASLANGTEVGAHLTTAADNMHVASVSLRDHKYSEAFDPEQNQALSELLAAKQLLEKQKQETDDSAEVEQKKTIKEAYAALLVLQEQVNLRTISLDAMPRKSDGTLRRQDLVRLAQLALMQQAVIDGASKLDEPLSKLGSIVYSWANKDLIKNMTQVQQLLDSREIDSVTQLHEKQVAVELKSFIDDMALKPKKMPPTSQPEGKGGEPPPGAGPPQMPTEPEVRLMLDLQLDINRTTLDLSQLPRPDSAGLVAVGTREGELRDLLDQLIRKASKGKSRLRPEADATERLPEETAGSTTRPQLKDQEPSKEDLVDLNLIGTRMIRVKRRLSVHGDAGNVTQLIQSGIVENLTTLLQRVRKNDSPKKNPPPQRKPKPKKKTESEEIQSGVDLANSESKGKGSANAGLSRSSSGSGGDGAPGQPGSDVAKQQARMWGTVTSKEREAVIESQTESVLDKYKSLVDDYYRAMSTQEDAH